MKIPPPAHEIRPEAPPSGQQIADVVVSKSGASRFLITSDANGLYRVFEEHWNTSWAGDGGSCFWKRNGPVHLADSLESARTIVLPLLADESEEA